MSAGATSDNRVRVTFLDGPLAGMACGQLRSGKGEVSAKIEVQSGCVGIDVAGESPGEYARV